MRRWRTDRGTALVEAAMTIPILLLIAAGIFEFGRAYQTWQVLTNAAREGARMSVLPNGNASAVEASVRQYLQNGQLPLYASAGVTVDRAASVTVNGDPEAATQVTVTYPFTVMVLQPVARMVNPGSSIANALTLMATAVMRNESS